jgi:ABC-type Fe3+-hydroxamate transport system substrate-binding protein
MEGKNMKKSILILACAAIAPFAFAQTSTTTTEKTTTTAPSTAKTTTTETTTYSAGTVTTYEPGKRIVVKGPQGPVDFVLGTTARILDGAGKSVTAPLRADQKVKVYYTGDGEKRVVERVVVDE